MYSPEMNSNSLRFNQDSRYSGMVPLNSIVCETDTDIKGRLFPAESDAIQGARKPRVAEYTTVRHCAREALIRLGVAPVAIISDPLLGPRWPNGIFGSLTHCPGMRAAVVARSCLGKSIGIDAEQFRVDLQNESLPRFEDTLNALEIQTGYPNASQLLRFSLEESAFKALTPLSKYKLRSRGLLLSSASSVSERLPDGTAEISLSNAMLANEPVKIDLKWRFTGSHLLTSAVIDLT